MYAYVHVTYVCTPHVVRMGGRRFFLHTSCIHSILLHVVCEDSPLRAFLKPTWGVECVFAV